LGALAVVLVATGHAVAAACATLHHAVGTGPGTHLTGVLLVTFFGGLEAGEARQAGDTRTQGAKYFTSSHGLSPLEWNILALPMPIASAVTKR
jgi:hypothetical protein